MLARILVIVAVMTFVASAMAVDPALARPGNGNGNGNGQAHGPDNGNGNGNGNHAEVTLNESSPHFADQVTFSIETSATEPWVKVRCYQAGEFVYFQSHGMFEGYASEPVYTLGPTPLWMGGGANCTADLYASVDGKILRSTEFGVLP